jgi:hypothetical protein
MQLMGGPTKLQTEARRPMAVFYLAKGGSIRVGPPFVFLGSFVRERKQE